MDDNRHAAARRSGERSAIDKQSRRWPVGAVALSMLSLTVADEQALASGYALREQSASALGNAFAGATAGAEDLSYMFFNPASLTRQSGSQLLGAAQRHRSAARVARRSGEHCGGHLDQRQQRRPERGRERHRPGVLRHVGRATKFEL